MVQYDTGIDTGGSVWEGSGWIMDYDEAVLYHTIRENGHEGKLENILDEGVKPNDIPCQAYNAPEWLCGHGAVFLGTREDAVPLQGEVIRVTVPTEGLWADTTGQQNRLGNWLSYNMDVAERIYKEDHEEAVVPPGGNVPCG